MLSVNRITARYNQETILRDLELKARPGEFIGIVGPNGSGKTTFLRCVARLLKPSIGKVLLGSDDLYSKDPVEVAKQIGFVPQSWVPSFEFTALEIVLMGRTAYLNRLQMESEDDIQLAKKSMKLTNCSHLENRLVTQLSGGERQRVIIAMVLTQEPSILLLDEPTLHLDLRNQLEILNLLKKLCNEEGLTVLAALHDFNLASRYSSKVMLIHQGQLESLGSPESVLKEENLRRFFGIRAIVQKNQETGFLQINPIGIS